MKKNNLINDIFQIAAATLIMFVAFYAFVGFIILVD